MVDSNRMPDRAGEESFSLSVGDKSFFLGLLNPCARDFYSSNRGKIKIRNRDGGHFGYELTDKKLMFLYHTLCTGYSNLNAIKTINTTLKQGGKMVLDQTEFTKLAEKVEPIQRRRRKSFDLSTFVRDPRKIARFFGGLGKYVGFPANIK